MSETCVLTFLTNAERALLGTLLEERLPTLIAALRRAEDTSAAAPIQDQVKITITLLDKLHRTSGHVHHVGMPPERKSVT